MPRQYILRNRNSNSLKENLTPKVLELRKYLFDIQKLSLQNSLSIVKNYLFQKNNLNTIDKRYGLNYFLDKVENINEFKNYIEFYK